MAKTGLLVVTNLSRVAHVLSSVHKHVNTTLYVQLYSEKRVTGNIAAPLYSKLITNIYSQASTICNKFDIRVLISSIKTPNDAITTKKSIDVIIFENGFKPVDTANFLSRYLLKDIPTIVLEGDTDYISDSLDCQDQSELKTYENVVLGGTFDRLHNGHKIMLSEAILRATNRVVVGVTDINMIQSKKLHELILPCEQRIAEVKEFLTDVDSSLVYDVVAIQDPAGPTKSDPNMELLIVSTETLRGGESVNAIRNKNNLPPLEIKCIDLIHGRDDQHNVMEMKVSSSNQRMELLGTRLKPPIRESNLPVEPYIIGLSGGIASGKSSVGARLNKLGAGLIECDKIGHELYQPGKKCYYLVVEQFGTKVLNDKNEIDRKILGGIVFNNKDELNKLNAILWPAIITEVKRRIAAMFKNEKYDIIVMEAAVLVQAKWKNECNEVWSCIIPPDEAVKRLQERNMLSVEEARLRINSQPDNKTYVSISNVVFSTYWSTEFTQSQVEKSWRLLKKHLNKPLNEAVSIELENNLL